MYEAYGNPNQAAVAEQARYVSTGSAQGAGLGAMQANRADTAMAKAATQVESLAATANIIAQRLQAMRARLLGPTPESATEATKPSPYPSGILGTIAMRLDATQAQQARALELLSAPERIM